MPKHDATVTLSYARPAPPLSTAHYFGVAVVLLLVPVLLLALPLPPTKFEPAIRKQNWIGGLTAALAVASLLAYYFPTPLFPQRKSIWPLILFVTSVLILGN